jgi:hypothetical protein
MAQLSNPRHKHLAREAKAIVALAIRNGPIETIHAGVSCPTCASQPGYSRITDEEMRAIMTNAVNRVFKLLCLKRDDPPSYESQIEFGCRYTLNWDEPQHAIGMSLHLEPDISTSGGQLAVRRGIRTDTASGVGRCPCIRVRFAPRVLSCTVRRGNDPRARRSTQSIPEPRQFYEPDV